MGRVRIRLLRWMELVLGLGLAALLLIAGAYRPAGFHPLHQPLHQPVSATGGVSAATGPRPAPPSPTPAPSAQEVLDASARRHGLDPHLVEAVAYWESGWDQSRISDTGAVGLMQVQPEVAAELAPRLLGRSVDLHDPADNAEAGVAILHAYIDDQGGNVDQGLAAYYQGPGSLQDDGVQPDTQAYVDGIDALKQLLDEGRPLPPPESVDGSP
jgi:soluble lytic murein transglycosylase-like protein